MKLNLLLPNFVFEADAVKHRRPSGSVRAPRRPTMRSASLGWGTLEKCVISREREPC